VLIAEASLQAADVYIKDQSLPAVPLTVTAARATLRRVRAAVTVSLGYNGIAASLAIAGLIHPLLAAVLMPASSLTVLAIAARRPAWDKKSRATTSRAPVGEVGQ
jgi:Cu2+-exporting ATPase